MSVSTVEPAVVPDKTVTGGRRGLRRGTAPTEERQESGQKRAGWVVRIIITIIKPNKPTAMT